MVTAADAVADANTPATVLSAEALGADTRYLPVLLTLGADGVVCSWALGLRGSDLAPVHMRLGQMDVASCIAAHVRGGAADGEDSMPPALARLGQSRPSSLVCDLVSASLGVLVGTEDGTLARLDLEARRLTFIARATPPAAAAPAALPKAAGHSASGITHLAYHPFKALIAAANAESAAGVSIFEGLTGRLMRTIASHPSATTGVSVDAGAGLFFATCGADGEVRVWGAADGTCHWRMKAHQPALQSAPERQNPEAPGPDTAATEAALSVAFHPARSNILASSGADGVIRIYFGKYKVEAATTQQCRQTSRGTVSFGLSNAAGGADDASNTEHGATPTLREQRKRSAAASVLGGSRVDSQPVAFPIARTNAARTGDAEDAAFSSGPSISPTRSRGFGDIKGNAFEIHK
jgi:WD40 repeat protein